MLCQSCHTECPETFKACIISNFCPSCGNSIMTPQQLYLKARIASTVSQALSTPSGRAFRTLDTEDAIGALASLLVTTMDASSRTHPAVGGPVMTAPPLPLGTTPAPAPVLPQFEPGEIEEEGSTSDLPSSVEVPANMRPKNRRPPKPVSRDGGLAPVQSPVPEGLSITDDIYAELQNSMLSGDSSVYQEMDIDNEAFFPSESGEASVISTEAGDVLFGVSDAGLQARVAAKKQKYEENKRKSGANVSRPVSRIGA